jgi:hypothetical protein
MKTKKYFAVSIFVLIYLNQMIAQSPITIYTPKGSSVYAHTRPEILNAQDKIDISAEMVRDYPDATEQNSPSATSTYNCHSFAWNMSEGGSTCTLAYYAGDTDESVYWSDNSYIETTEPYASKISYYADDHSAIQTSTQGIYISKWGDYPKMQHARNYGPAIYQMSYRKYYKLNPGLSGSTALMCASQQRTVTSNTSITGSTYSWTRETSLLDPVSGAGTTSYTVSGTSGTGNAFVRLEITTPSGEVATTADINWWVGKAQVQSISGPSTTTRNAYNYYYANTNHSSGTSYNWMVSPSGPYVSPSGGEVNSCLVIFYTTGYYTVLARAVNACGTTTWSGKSVYVSGGKSLSLYPNPASDNVTLTIKENPLLILNDSVSVDPGASQPSIEESTNYTIRIFNNQSTLLFSAKRSGNTFNIPLNNMKDGTYIIEVSNGKTSYTQQLIVKH